MFFHFISEKKKVRKWDETHLPDQVILPRQVLIIGDGHAEKRSYDEHGNQARIYAGRPGHGAVAQVGLKGVFLKDGESQRAPATACSGRDALPLQRAPATACSRDSVRATRLRSSTPPWHARVPMQTTRA